MHPRSTPALRAALADLKQGLRGAELVHLGPGERADQASSWVLLRGSLRTTGRAYSVPAAASGAPPARWPSVQGPVLSSLGL